MSVEEWYGDARAYERHSNSMEEKQARKDERDWIRELTDVLRDVPFTFSQYCCSGIVYLLGADRKCQCHRCRTDRGEPVTAETEDLAKAESLEAQKIWKERQREWLKKQKLR